MRDIRKWQGAWTALITPFKQDESIDWPAWETLIKEQIESGITGILVNGTTGESPTITNEEFGELIVRAKELTKDKCLLMVGSGTNNTKKSIELSQKARNLGADVLLLVNPYYNKPTQEGLYLHFKTIAENVRIPIFLYNIKGRTAVNLETSTLSRLIQDVPNIAGVKEASGDIAQIGEVCGKVPENFTVLSGDDNLTYQIMSKFGAHGVISVVSNIVPKEVARMVNYALEKKYENAWELNEKLKPLFSACFIETNPIPIKAFLFLMGKISEVYRLPLCQIQPSNREKLRQVLGEMDLGVRR